jgi:hypothetical protein
MNALTKLFSLVGFDMRSRRRPLLAAMLAFPLALPAIALAQHAGSGGHGYYSHGYYGHGYYGHGYYYGRGYYGGWGGWWYPWAYGAFLTVLPWYYTTYWWNGAPYYYADDTYYRWNAAARGYEVVPAPRGGAEAAAGSGGAPSVSAELFAYPMNGQATALQAQDRYECHRWAADQTAFDPTQASGAEPTEEAMAKRGAYVRAETACLTGRGYSVK